MSENVELKDKDVVLDSMIAMCTTVSSTSLKRVSPSNNEEGSSKKPKLAVPTEAVSPQNSTDKSTTAKNSSSTKSKISNAIRRIFPGPAGILSEENITSSQMEVYSQGTNLIFQDSPWKEMSKDFKVDNSTYLYDKFNISWIKKESTANQNAIQKAPFLACILHSLEVLSNGQTPKSVNVTLKDKTGTIQGTILLTLYEDYASHLTVGSVLILVKFGFLSCSCDKCDNHHHLTITPKNLSAIYNDKTKIIIKQVEPQTLLTEFYKYKKEPELNVRNKTLMKSDIPNRTFFLSNSRHSFNINNRSVSDSKNSYSSNVRNQIVNVNYPHNTPEKCSSVNNFVLPTFKSMCKDTAQYEPPTTSVIGDNINNTSNNYTNEHKKMFTFKKISCSEANLSSLLPCQNSNQRVEIKDSSSIIKLSQDTCSSKIPFLNDSAVDSSNVRCLNNVKSFHRSQESVNCLSEPKNSFNLYKVPLSEINDRAPLTHSINDLGSTTSKSNKNCTIMNKIDPGSSIQISGGQVSVTVDCVEHQKLWEDVLDNVDLNSLFDDDF